MKMKNGTLIEDQKSTKTFKDHLFKYLAKWPIFLITLTICIGAGFISARYTTPKYLANLVFYVKSANRVSGDLIEEALSGKREINLNNEMLLLTSTALIERVVEKGSFNIGYAKAGSILDVNIYLNAPFRLIVKDSNENNLPVTLRLKNLTVTGGNGFIGTDEKGKPFSFKWNTPFEVGSKTFALTPSRTIKSGDGNYLVTWRPISYSAALILGTLSVAPFDTKSSAIQLSLKSENLDMGKDILNTIYTEFNLSNIEDRTNISENTVRFINERLHEISLELSGVESDLQSYKGSRRLADISTQTTQSLGGSNTTAEKIKDLGVQQRVATMLKNYFQNPDNNNTLVPSTLGLGDQTLSSLINQYNEIQARKEREAPNVAPNSTVMQQFNAQIANLKSSIIESLNNVTNNLDLQEKSFQQRNNEFSQFLVGVPGSEREIKDINRKQAVTEGIYLYLLQKREEMAISSTSASVSLYKQIDAAKGYGPVEPNVRKSILLFMVLGIALSYGFIFLSDLLNDKVYNREDVTGKLNLQIFGDISHLPKRKKPLIAALSQGIVGEQFRAIRTNLSFVLKGKSAKTILITSSTASEGKSFVSLNLAAVCAIPGKRVALVEFDIRKPHLSTSLNFHNEKGITDYLAGDVTNITEIAHALDEIPTLHIYPCGTIPTNPADLLLAENVSRLFEALKYQYDYIIIDSPPVGMVSDALVLGEFSDLVLYVIRQRTTLKKHLDFINDLESNEKLNNVGLILNDMKTGGNYGYYGYGYGQYKYSNTTVKA